MLIKRFFDFSFALVGITVLSPIFIIISCLIKFTDGGPVFFRGYRVGLNGKLFKIFKFRSMVVGADKLGGQSTSADDSRITHLGKILRKYKLDEIPQLLNVLVGDMSIVGPRPEVPYYVNLYSYEEKIILTLRPGITDWASIGNPDEGAILLGSVDPEKTYLEKIRPEKIRLQLKYVRERTFWIDMKIIILTIMVVIKMKKDNR